MRRAKSNLAAKGSNNRAGRSARTCWRNSKLSASQITMLAFMKGSPTRSSRNLNGSTLGSTGNDSLRYTVTMDACGPNGEPKPKRPSHCRAGPRFSPLNRPVHGPASKQALAIIANSGSQMTSSRIDQSRPLSRTGPIGGSGTTWLHTQPESSHTHAAITQPLATRAGLLRVTRDTPHPCSAGQVKQVEAHTSLER